MYEDFVFKYLLERIEANKGSSMHSLYTSTSFADVQFYIYTLLSFDICCLLYSTKLFRRVHTIKFYYMVAIEFGFQVPVPCNLKVRVDLFEV